MMIQKSTPHQVCQQRIQTLVSDLRFFTNLDQLSVPEQDAWFCHALDMNADDFQMLLSSNDLTHTFSLDELENVFRSLLVETCLYVEEMSNLSQSEFDDWAKTVFTISDAELEDYKERDIVPTLQSLGVGRCMVD